MAKLILKGSPEAISEQFGLGGEIGGGLGAIAGNFIPIPGVGPLIGRIGGQLLGEGIESLFGRKKRRREERRQREWMRNTNRLEGDLGEPQFEMGGALALLGPSEASIDTYSKVYPSKMGRTSKRTLKLRYRDGGKLSEIRKRPGGSNVGKKKFADGSPRRGPYAGTSGGAPSGSYPIPDKKHARAALRLAHHAPNPAGIRKKVYQKYPSLKRAGGGPLQTNAEGGNYYAYSAGPTGPKKKKRLQEGGPIRGNIVKDVKEGARILGERISNFWSNNPTALRFARGAREAAEGFANVATLGGRSFSWNLPTEQEMIRERSRREREETMQRHSDMFLDQTGSRASRRVKFRADGGPLYAEGGRVKKIRPGDDAVLIAGPRHEEGGVDLPAFGAEVEGGETIDNVRLAQGGRTPFVFSDRVAVPGRKMTFADVHKKAVKRGAGEQFVSDLAYAQESVKEGPVNTSVGASGLLQFPKRGYQDGGSLDDPRRVISKIPTGPGSFANPIVVQGVPEISSDMLRQPPTLAANVGSSLSSGNGFLENINLEDVAQFAGPVANILGGLAGVNKAVDAPRVSRASLGPIHRMRTRFNINPALAEQRRAFSTLARNPAATPNQLLAGFSQSLRNRSQLKGQKENVETELRNRQLGALSQAIRDLDLTDQRTAAFNAQNRQAARAANLNLIGAGLGQVGEVIGQRKQDERLQRASESQLAAALASADPDVLEFFMNNQDELRRLARTFRYD